MKLINNDCIAAMKEMPDNSVDSIVTDPPYELGFMGKSWDSTGIAFNVGVWKEALRVLKPGGHLIAFSGSRTYHRMAVAIEDAGFEIRDQIMWVYGSGFPKSLNVSKAIDKAAGATPIETGLPNNMNSCLGGSACNCETDGTKFSATKHAANTIPATADAKQWKGWGTALKPAHEPMVLARKPIAGTVANNVLTYGVGGINIDGTRAEEDRWPANFIHDGLQTEWSKFFYCAKTSKRDRNEGLDGFEVKQQDESRKEGNPGGDNPRNRGVNKVANYHPTVKPTDLMRYLVRLVTPTNGIVLDPFMGSGSTGKACAYEGFNFIGIDQSSEYVEIARARINFAMDNLDADI